MLSSTNLAILRLLHEFDELPASLNLIYCLFMKQRQKSRKTSSRLANDPCPIVSAYLHTKQPATSGKSYLQFPDKVIHTTYESQHEKGLAEGQSLECRSNSRPK
jgi:hypothetical protein